MADPKPEFWLRGPVRDVPLHLQPVAHALLQAQAEVESLMDDFPAELLWTRPGGVASVGFHLQHVSGVLDRLFTYARGEGLSAAQREALAAEQAPPRPGIGVGDLVEAIGDQVELALEQLRVTETETLLEVRSVGRMHLPSNVLGLLFHAAEHVQRHVGQLHVTARVQRANSAC